MNPVRWIRLLRELFSVVSAALGLYCFHGHFLVVSVDVVVVVVVDEDVFIIVPSSFRDKDEC